MDILIEIVAEFFTVLFGSQANKLDADGGSAEVGKDIVPDSCHCLYRRRFVPLLETFSMSGAHQLQTETD